MAGSKRKEAESKKESLSLDSAISEIDRVKQVNPPQAVALAENTWLKVKETVSPRQQIPFLICYANCLATCGRFGEAHQMISLALSFKLRSRVKDLELGWLMANAGEKLLNLNSFEEALILLNKAKALFIKLEAIPETIDALLSLGRCYDGLLNFALAAEHLFQAEQLARKHKLSAYQIRIATSLGNVYVDTQDLVKGARYYKQAAVLALKQHKMVLYAGALSNLSKVYTLTEKFDLAFSTANEAIKVYEEHHQVNQLSTMLHNVGILLNAAKRPDEALVYLKKALSSHRANDKPVFYLSVYLNIINSYFQLSNFRLANHHLQRIIPQAQEIKAQGLLLPLYLQGYQISAAQKKWKQALDYFTRAKEIESDILDRDKSLQLNQLEQEFNKIREEQQTEIYRLRNVELKKRNKLINEQKVQLEIALAEIKAANDAKSKLFSIVAHDMRGPLSRLYQGIELIADQDSSLKDDSEFLAELKRSSFEVYALTDNLLRWAAQQLNKIVVNPKLIKLEPIIRKVIEQHAFITSAKSITIITDIQADKQIMADPGFVYVVFRNLLSNAIKFSPVNSEVKVKVCLQGTSYRISITDKGRGIEPERQKQLFDGQINASSPGTDMERGVGLGLNLVKEFVDLMSGTVSVSSAPGMGSTFTFTIPARMWDSET